jgi:RNA polymerase sigma-70 factor (ECF subfamily)
MVQSIPQEFEENESARSFSDLTGEYYEPVFGFIARQSPNQADAADITQQAFIRAFKNFARYDPSRDFAPWIYTIARRCVADFYRQRRQTMVGLDESLTDPAPGPSEVTAQREGADNLWELARGLKVKHYQVLLLHYKENFSLRETAEIMGVTLTHAKVLLFRARSAMKKRIESTQAIGGINQ